MLGKWFQMQYWCNKVDGYMEFFEKLISPKSPCAHYMLFNSKTY